MSNKNTNKNKKTGRVTKPYIKTVSENLAKIYKRYNIEKIHKQTTKLKSLLYNKMKDKIPDLHKTGAVYYNTCQKHKNVTT